MSSLTITGGDVKNGQIILNTEKPKPIFYTINFNNITERIEFEPNVGEKRLEVTSLLLSLFDNISPGLNTDTFKSEGVKYVLNSGLYTAGIDLISALNTVTAGVLTWTFMPITKRIKVESSGGVNFSIDDCRLLNLILGFDNGSIDGSNSEYTSVQIMNLFPWSHYLLKCDKVESSSYYDSNKQISMAIPVNTFDYVSATSITFDKNGYFNNSMRTYVGNLFPMRLQLSVLFLDNSQSLIPFAKNQKCSLTLCVY